MRAATYHVGYVGQGGHPLCLTCGGNDQQHELRSVTPTSPTRCSKCRRPLAVRPSTAAILAGFGPYYSNPQKGAIR